MGKSVLLRSIRVEGEVALVPLTRGRDAIIYAEDISLVSGRNWYSHQCYARTRAREGEGLSSHVQMHRIITSAPDGVFVDHINGDGLDNRKSNLRFATNAQNVCNTGLSKGSTSGLKGATKLKNANRWQSSIVHNRRFYYLGCFETPEEAHAAYCEAAIRLHGEFARFS